MTPISSLPVVADVEVGRHVPLDLGVASAEGREHGEGEQLAGRHVDPGAGVVVAEAVGGQELLEVQLVIGRRRVHALDPVRPDDLLLHCPALLGAGGGRGRGLSVERQLDAALGQDVVGGVDEVEDLAHPGVGDGLVDDLPGLDRGDPDGEGGAEHDPVLAQRLAADERRELHHEPGPGIWTIRSGARETSSRSTR